MSPAEVVAVRVAGDGVFIEFADGVASFFPSTFLQSHRKHNPNQLFVPEPDQRSSPSSFRLPTQAALVARLPCADLDTRASIHSIGALS